MARKSDYEFFSELFGNVTQTHYIPLSIRMRAVAVNMLCEETEDTKTNRQRSAYVGQGSGAGHTFSNAIGGAAANIFSWPALACSAARHCLIAGVEKIILGKSFSPTKTPWYGVAMKVAVTAAFCIPETICYGLSKAADILGVSSLTTKVGKFCGWVGGKLAGLNWFGKKPEVACKKEKSLLVSQSSSLLITKKSATSETIKKLDAAPPVSPLSKVMGTVLEVDAVKTPVASIPIENEEPSVVRIRHYKKPVRPDVVIHLKKKLASSVSDTSDESVVRFHSNPSTAAYLKKNMFTRSVTFPTIGLEDIPINFAPSAG